MKSPSRARLFATPWTAAHQAPLSVNVPGKSAGVGGHCLLRELSLDIAKCHLQVENDCSGEKTHSGAIVFQTPLQPLLGSSLEVYGPVDFGLCFHCLEPRFNSWGWETEISQASWPKTNKQKSLLKLPFQKREHFPSSAGNAFSLELMLFYFP